MKKFNSGVSLVTVAAALAIISAAAYLFIQMSGTMIFAGSRIDQSLKGQQILVGVASEIQRMDFGQILSDVCKNSTAGLPIAGNCVTADGKLKSLADQTQPALGQPQVNVLLSENGKPSANGEMCVELNSCQLIAEDDMLEMKLTGYWKDPDPKKGLFSRVQLLRRVRW